MCAPFFGAVPRPFGTRASLRRPHDFLRFRTAAHSKGAAALRQRSTESAPVGRRAVMRFALRDVALQRLIRGH